MGRNLVSVDFDFNGATFRIQGANYFYDDENIRDNIGCDKTDDNDLGGKVIIDHKVAYQRVLVPLIAVMRKSNAGDVGDAAQSDRTRYFRFFCNPYNVGEAMDDLPGKDVRVSARKKAPKYA